ncbi:MAG: low molecular weight phosphotyrosine protein phosphatase [Paludibacter sp.]|nr:low molecular weight phosphotyrosine protein phosphatase [Paludibacter sp.]MBP6355800.1 low molecular weight phosphotyrosine protein phosphatase [Paludibacter sp.]
MHPTSILFVCLGNICRSPMAEGVFRQILKQNGILNELEIDSAGLIAYHQGELPDSRMRYFAEKRGYHLDHHSRPFTRLDFERFDMIIGMDDKNIDGLKAHAMTKEEEKQIFRMTDFCRNVQADHVPDPYYGGDQGFEHVIDILEDACRGLFDDIMASKSQ